MKGAFGQYIFVNSKRFNVPLALISKSIKGLFFAQSCDGCAAACITTLIFFLYFLKISFNDLKFLISVLK